MNAPRVVFLDFDGTLGDHGIIPKAHVHALREARARGHLIFLCTGRPASMVAPSVMRELDGLVASAGSFVQVGPYVLRNEYFPRELALRTLDVLEQRDIAFVLESDAGMFGNDKGVHNLNRLLETFNLGGSAREEGSVGQGADDIRRALVEGADLREVQFSKVVHWRSNVSTQSLVEEIGPEVIAMPNSVASDGTLSGEIQRADIDKIDGVRMVAEHLHHAIIDVVAAGDGLNDVGMLSRVGTSIVIEGSRALDELANPDIVVPGPRDAGLVRAFRDLGMLGTPEETGRVTT